MTTLTIQKHKKSKNILKSKEQNFCPKVKVVKCTMDDPFKDLFRFAFTKIRGDYNISFSDKEWVLYRGHKISHD